MSRAEASGAGDKRDRGEAGWARATLAGELSRATSGVAPGPEPSSTAPLADAAERLESRLRRAAAVPVPPEADRGSPAKRALRIALHRLLRPATRRSDLASAELAGLLASVAERLERCEAELEALRSRLGQAEGEGR